VRQEIVDARHSTDCTPEENPAWFHVIPYPRSEADSAHASP
jgi:hypothetical protein